jgi:GntR family transcriptional regulator/MocR family aminotransferase
MPRGVGHPVGGTDRRSRRRGRAALLARARADAVLIARAHSYPSGGTLDGARRQALATWADRSGALIIEDDYDAELRYDRRPLGALQGLAPEHTMYIGTASKTLTPALRLGWLIAPPT